MAQLKLFSDEAEAVKKMESEGVNEKGVRKQSDRQFIRSTPEEITALISKAILNGTHKSETKFVCTLCNEWVDGIFSFDIQNSRRRFCRKCCAEKLGMESAKEKEKAVEDELDFLRPEDMGLPVIGV